MGATLQYDLSIVGEASIKRALKSIERSFAQHNTAMARIGGGGPGARGGAYRSSAPGPGRGRSVLAGFDEIGRAARASYLKDGRERVRAEVTSNRKIERERQSHIRRMEREHIQVARRTARSRERFTRGTLGTVGRSAGNSLRAVGGLAAAGLGIGGGFAVAGAVRQSMDLDRRVRQSIVSSRGPGERGAFTPAELTGKIQATSISTGAPLEQVMGGVEEFVKKTGDIKTAVANMQNFATVAMATGSSVEDVASAAADLKEKFDLSKPDEMAEALAGLAFQGKRGAFELRDMAGQFPKIAAAAARFGFKGAKGVRELGGFAQIARSATGSGEQAASAVEATLRQLVSKSKEIQSGSAFGGRKVNVFEGGDPTKNARRASDVLTDVISASRGDVTQLQKVFGEEGIRGISPLITAFRKGSEGAGPVATGKQRTAAGRAAVEKMFRDAIEGPGGFKDAQKDAADIADSSAVKFDVAMMKFQTAIGDKLLPELTKLIPVFVKLTPHLTAAATLFAKFVDSLSKNPLGTVGKLIAAKVALDIATAGIGNAAKGAIVKSITGSGGVGGGVGGKGGIGKGGGLMGAGVTGAAIGISVASAIITAGVVNFEAGEASMAESGRALNLARGSSDPEEIAKIRREEIAKLDAAKAPGMVETAATELFKLSPQHLLGKLLGDKDISKEVGQGVAEYTTARDPAAIKTHESNVAELTKLLGVADMKAASEQQKQAATVLKEAGEAIKSAAGGTSPNRTASPSPVK